MLNSGIMGSLLPRVVQYSCLSFVLYCWFVASGLLYYCLCFTVLLPRIFFTPYWTVLLCCSILLPVLYCTVVTCCSICYQSCTALLSHIVLYVLLHVLSCLVLLVTCIVLYWCHVLDCTVATCCTVSLARVLKPCVTLRNFAWRFLCTRLMSATLMAPQFVNILSVIQTKCAEKGKLFNVPINNFYSKLVNRKLFSPAI